MSEIKQPEAEELDFDNIENQANQHDKRANADVEQAPESDDETYEEPKYEFFHTDYMKKTKQQKAFMLLHAYLANCQRSDHEVLLPLEIDIVIQCVRLLNGVSLEGFTLPVSVRDKPFGTNFLYFNSTTPPNTVVVDPFGAVNTALTVDVKNNNTLVFKRPDEKKASLVDTEITFVNDCPLNVEVKENGAKVMDAFEYDNDVLYDLAFAFRNPASRSRYVELSTGVFSLTPIAASKKIGNGDPTFTAFWKFVNEVASNENQISDYLSANCAISVSLRLKNGKSTVSKSVLPHELNNELDKFVICSREEKLKIRRWLREGTVLNEGFAKSYEWGVNNNILQHAVADKHAQIFKAVEKMIENIKRKKKQNDSKPIRLAYVGVVIPKKKAKKFAANLGVAQFTTLMQNEYPDVELQYFDVDAKDQSLDGEPTVVKIACIGDILVRHVNICLSDLDDFDIVVSDANFEQDKALGRRNLNDQSMQLIVKRMANKKYTIAKMLYADGFSKAGGLNSMMTIVAKGRVHSGEVFCTITSTKNEKGLDAPKECYEADKYRGNKIKLIPNSGSATICRTDLLDYSAIKSPIVVTQQDIEAILNGKVDNCEIDLSLL